MDLEIEPVNDSDQQLAEQQVFSQPKRNPDERWVLP